MSTTFGGLKLLEDGARLFSITLSNKQLSQFNLYRELLLQWNERINLTTITDDAEIQIRHFLDSLTCTIVTGDLNGAAVIDGGTGAGFPGIPLKILFPQMRLTLVESVGKKLPFLGAVVESLGLREVDIVGARLEEAGQDPRHREAYDWSLTRGVAHMAVLVEYQLPLCRIGGKALSQKGEGVIGELHGLERVIERLGGGQPVLTPVRLPGRELTHYLAVIPKINTTPAQYPRRPGIPIKRPLT